MRILLAPSPLLTITFSILKLCGIVDWSWHTCFLPLTFAAYCAMICMWLGVLEFTGKYK